MSVLIKNIVKEENYGLRMGIKYLYQMEIYNIEINKNCGKLGSNKQSILYVF